jgi:ADP-heptose:LPS heptosyltransferase
LVFSNGEKIGDGLIKLPLLNEIKRRLPEYKIVWMTNRGRTVYNNQLKNIAIKYIDQIIEKANLNPFFWQKISNIYNLKDLSFDYIFDTQKAVLRTFALKRIKCSVFISASAAGFFSDKKIQIKSKKIRKYYLEDLFDLLNLIKEDNIDRKFTIPIPHELENSLIKIFDNNKSYIGIAPGAGEKNKIWPLENFIKVANYFEKKSYKLVFFLGPQEKLLKVKLMNIFPEAILPEEKIVEFTGPEVVMATTKFLSCALTNDSGVSHMLSTNYCPIIKLFGPKDSDKFTQVSKSIHTINSKEYGSNNIEEIQTETVINKMNNLLS